MLIGMLSCVLYSEFLSFAFVFANVATFVTQFF